MHPILFELGPITVYTYGVLLAAAFLVGVKVAAVRAGSRGIDPGRVLDLGIWIIVSAVVGAKLLLLITDFEYFRQNPGDIFSLARAGGVFYGGLIAAVAVAIWYVRRHRLPLLPMCDAAAPGIALGHAVGRLGCFFAGCCYGRPASVPWAVTFSDPFAASYVGTPIGVALHPTQLYEAATELAIMAALLLSEKRWRPFPGRTFWLYGALYGVSRFVIEFYRGDERGTLLGLPTSQSISIGLVLLSAVMLIRLARRPAPAAATEADASGTRTTRTRRPGSARRP